MEAILNGNVQLYLLAYLLGSIPFGWIFVKVLIKKDIRTIGSGGSGATNVYRALKDEGIEGAKKYAILTIVLDALKSLLPLLIAKLMGVPPTVLWAMALFFVVGHCYSVFLFFEGGKGVATAFGALLVMIPIEALIGFAVWFLSAKFSKISSLSSLLGLLATVVAAFFIHPGLPPIDSNTPLWLIAFFVLYKHLPNIIRLIKGEEKQLAV